MNNKKFLAAIIILAIFSTLFFIFRICNIFLIEPPLASIATDGLQSIESNKLSSSSKKNPADDLVLQAKRKEIFAYSRDGNFKNTRNRLKNAWDAGVINQKEYYGELAHMLSVSVENPESIVREVVTSRDKYGIEVMLSILARNNFLADSLSESAKKQIHDDVYTNKPEITGFIGDLGLADVYRYENWLGTLKTFSKNDEDFVKNLNEIILNEMTDPREALGIRSMVDNHNYLEKLSKEAKDKYLYYIDNYIKSYSSNEKASYINSKK